MSRLLTDVRTIAAAAVAGSSEYKMQLSRIYSRSPVIGIVGREATRDLLDDMERDLVLTVVYRLLKERKAAVTAALNE